MRQLKLSSIFELAENPPRVISFIGSGGKTTIISKLASELNSAGRKVLITTTTKLFPFPGITTFTAKNELNVMDKLKNHFADNNLAVYGNYLTPENKIEGISRLEIAKLKEELNVTILVEADGSRGLPVKGYNPDEPVIPGCTDLIVALAGADAIGKPLNNHTVHRPEQLAAGIQVETGSPITEEILALTYNYMLTAAKNQAAGAELICILNKIDLLKDESSGILKLIDALSDLPVRPGYLLGTDTNSPEPVKMIFNIGSERPLPKVAAIILAAGSAKRMGEDKLKLSYGKHTILEQTLENVNKADFDEIVLVIKPGSDWADRLNESNYTLVENHEHISGLSTSLKAGLRAVSSSIQGSMFILGDQPGITSSLYSKLIYAYRSNLKYITAPIYDEKRGNPTIFDRRTWPILLQLSGDQGGKSLFKQFKKNQLDYIETNEKAIIEDIDTPGDYSKLIKNSNKR